MTAQEDALGLAEEQLASALQLIACFVLTDEEVYAANPDAHPGNLDGWAKSMREELLADYRDELVASLQRRGFFTNTHPGFPLTSLKGPGPMEHYRSLLACRKLAEGWEREEGRSLESLRQTVNEYLIAEGFSPEAAFFAENQGAVMLLQAEMKSLVAEGRGKA